MQFLSDFADQELLLPLGLIWVVVLAATGWRRGALAWIAVLAGTLGCLAVLKIVFLACGRHWTDGVLASPSGHTGAAALFYGGCALLMVRPRGAARFAVLLLPPLLAAVVGVSRIMLHAHTLAEVGLGGLVGSLGAFLLRPLAGPPPPQLARIRMLLLAAVPVLVLLHGSRLHAEDVLRQFTIAGLWPPASCRAPS
jgi:membrane-associated phospholipid phosphatase